MTPIARFHSPFTSKFGIPRQSGMTSVEGRIVFEPEFRNADALRGLEGFDYVWLIWEFSENVGAKKSPTVRPPILGGNERLGVWATRSPFRPNNLGLSSVRLLGIDLDTPDGPVIRVEGADLMDGTPIFDIKPYVPHADCHPDARSGFADPEGWRRLEVVMPQAVVQAWEQSVGKTDGHTAAEERPAAQLDVLREALALDPRPHYHDDPQRVYGFSFAGREVKFQVAGGVLTVIAVE